MNIALIDNDLCFRKLNHFPNLALMKLSAHHKSIGDNVKLINIDEFDNCLFTPNYDKVYLAKVFSDTFTPLYIENKGIIKGGSGFYFDEAEKLPDYIEHIKPDYELYSSKVIGKFITANKQQYFTDFSIGFTTRGCIRKCSFCINKNYSKVEIHSPINEFLDNKRPFIMLLDDNITASKDYFKIFEELNQTGKKFIFKQGMDIRLMTDDKIRCLLTSNYYIPRNTGNRVFHFAFDNISDKQVIQKKIDLFNFYRTSKHILTFYVLTGFDRNGKYDYDFYLQDFMDLIERVKILFNCNCQPYVMKHENYKKSPFLKFIEGIALYCNSPINYGKTLREYLIWKGVNNSELFFECDFKIRLISFTKNTQLRKSLTKV